MENEEIIFLCQAVFLVAKKYRKLCRGIDCFL